MAYNEEQDKLVMTIGTTEDGISVQIRQYNGGPEKVALIRIGKGGRTWKLGRIGDVELMDLIPILQHAEEYLRCRMEKRLENDG
jgi:hypothetical protein